MSYYAIVLVPHLVKLDTDSRIIASEKAREFVRRQKPVQEHTACVLSIYHEGSEKYPPPLPPAA